MESFTAGHFQEHERNSSHSNIDPPICILGNGFKPLLNLLHIGLYQVLDKIAVSLILPTSCIIRQRIFKISLSSVHFADILETFSDSLIIMCAYMTYWDRVKIDTKLGSWQPTTLSLLYKLSRNCTVRYLIKLSRI